MLIILISLHNSEYLFLKQINLLLTKNILVITSKKFLLTGNNFIQKFNVYSNNYIIIYY